MLHFWQRYFCRALKARNSTAQGEGRRAAEALGYDRNNESPEGAAQVFYSALIGLNAVFI
jgi:hypothetical protein